MGAAVVPFGLCRCCGGLREAEFAILCKQQSIVNYPKDRTGESELEREGERKRERVIEIGEFLPNI